ncbi:FAD/NAD-P-binding domain-containing protein, partial [Trametes gibbosa]
EGRRNICVVGAGPGGLAAVKIIKDSPQFKAGEWTVTAFEARDSIGGIWLPAPPTGDPPLTPLYDSLTTNLPHPVMAYTSFSFPPGTALFPPASTVLTYLDAYASHFELYPHIRLNTAVLSATRDPSGPAGKWTVIVRTGAAHANSTETHTFDHLVVANGHYRTPRLPATPGLARWVDARKAFHAVHYRNPGTFGAAQTVLVVGAGPSGQDLITDLLASGRTVVHSATGAVRDDVRDGRLKVRGRVAQYLDPAAGKVLFEDGTEESCVDSVVLATGYKVECAFLPPALLQHALPPGAPPLPRALYNSTHHVFPLARHVFPLVDADTLPPSSIAFVGLPVRVAPLPLLEAQMRAILHVFEHPDSLDPTEEAIDIVARYEFLRTQLAIARAWHRFDGHEQFAYRDALHAFAGHPLRVPAWEIEMYDVKGVLREEWRDLERAGLADEWARGVGEGGIEQWVEMMHKLLKRAEERHLERSRL